MERQRKKNLFNIISVKIIPCLATIDPSSFSINTPVTKPEPACGSGAIAGSKSGGCGP